MITAITDNSVLQMPTEAFKIFCSTPRLASTPMYCITSRLINSFSTSNMQKEAACLKKDLGGYCFLFEGKPSKKDVIYWRQVLDFVTRGYDMPQAIILLDLGIIPAKSF